MTYPLEVMEALYPIMFVIGAAVLCRRRHANIVQRLLVLALGVSVLAIVLQDLLAAQGMHNHWIAVVGTRLQGALFVAVLTTTKPRSRVLRTAAPFAIGSWVVIWLQGGVSFTGEAWVDISIFGGVIWAAWAYRRTALGWMMMAYAVPSVLVAPLIAFWGHRGAALEAVHLLASGDAWSVYLMWYQIPVVGQLAGTVMCLVWLLRSASVPTSNPQLKAV